MDSKPNRKAPVTIQADADHEVVTTPLFKLYQTNPSRLRATFCTGEVNMQLAHSPPS